ncbi:MAG: hypothetical protein ACRECQ_12890 [Burkholderiaceae bacterium]
MTTLKSLIAAAAVALGLLTVAESATARGFRHGHHHHGHHHHGGARFSFGFWGGPGYWGPGYWGPGWGYWGPPAIAYSPTVIVREEPRVWVESDQASTTPTPPVTSNTNPNAPQWWYWCASSRGYYPYVASCAEGWQRVTPQAAPPR